jgi:hypothetical protein
MSIVDFYRSNAPDYLGRRLSDILSWDDEHLEMHHNYIQVLFPLPESSMFNFRAPLLDPATIDTFHRDEQLRANLARAFERMLSFYGFRFDPTTGQVLRSDHFAQQAMNWLWSHNHNYLRITRILRCLTLLGLGDRAVAFFDALRDVYRQSGPDIGAETFRYWQAAAEGKNLDERANPRPGFGSEW